MDNQFAWLGMAKYDSPTWAEPSRAWQTPEARPRPRSRATSAQLACRRGVIAWARLGATAAKASVPRFVGSCRFPSVPGSVAGCQLRLGFKGAGSPPGRNTQRRVPAGSRRFKPGPVGSPSGPVRDRLAGIRRQASGESAVASVAWNCWIFPFGESAANRRRRWKCMAGHGAML